MADLSSMNMESLSYKELQDLAKENGIKANQNKAVLVEELKNVKKEGGSAEEEKMETNEIPEVSQNPTVEEISPETENVKTEPETTSMEIESTEQPQTEVAPPEQAQSQAEVAPPEQASTPPEQAESNALEGTDIAMTPAAPEQGGGDGVAAPEASNPVPESTVVGEPEASTANTEPTPVPETDQIAPESSEPTDAAIPTTEVAPDSAASAEVAAPETAATATAAPPVTMETSVEVAAPETAAAATAVPPVTSKEETAETTSEPEAAPTSPMPPTQLGGTVVAPNANILTALIQGAPESPSHEATPGPEEEPVALVKNEEKTDTAAETSAIVSPTAMDAEPTSDVAAVAEVPVKEETAAADSAVPPAAVTATDSKPAEEVPAPTATTETVKQEEPVKMEAEEAPPGEEAPKPKDEVYEKYWAAVTQNPLDFNTWVKLLSHVEKKADWDVASPVFDAFLTEFPLCFGYWCKLADFRAKTGSDAETKEISDALDEQIIAIYERGVVGVRYSVEMWHKYGIYMAEKRAHDPEKTRKVYQRAVEAVGSDPKSAPLWRKYIKFEINSGNKSAAASVYDQAIRCRISDLPGIWEEYKVFVEENELGPLASGSEYQHLKSKVMERKREEAEKEAEEKRIAKEKAAEARAAAAAEDPDLAPGGISDEEEGAPGSVTIPDPEVTDEEVKAEYLASREEIKNATYKEVETRAEFESVIKRPYFHVKPLDEKQLQNWREYLQFEENAGTPVPLTDHLYERCVVACANYSEFWIKYAQWKEKAMSPEASHEVAHRACSIFLKYRPDIHLFYADLLESHGYVEEARQVYRNVTGSVAAGLVEAFIRFANFERRAANLKGAEEVYRALLAASSQTTDPAHATTRPFVALHFARFQIKVLQDIEGARATYKEAREAQPDKSDLWLASLQFEMDQVSQKMANGGSTSEDMVEDVFKQIVAESSKLSAEVQHEAWQLYMEFKEDFGLNIKDVRITRGKYDKFQLKLGDSKKRAAPSSFEGDNAKQQKTEAASASNGSAASAATSVAADPNAAAAAAAAATTAYSYPQQPAYDANTAAYQNYYAQHTSSYPQYSYPQQY